MSEHKIPIPSRLYNAAVDGHVAGADQIIDDNFGKTQNIINAETNSKFKQIDNEIEGFEKQDIIPVDTLPDVATADPKKIYRVVNEKTYTDYMVNTTGDSWKKIYEAEFPGIDDEPVANSKNLVKSGGVENYVNISLKDIGGDFFKQFREYAIIGYLSTNNNTIVINSEFTTYHKVPTEHIGEVFLNIVSTVGAVTFAQFDENETIFTKIITDINGKVDISAKTKYISICFANAKTHEAVFYTKDLFSINRYIYKNLLFYNIGYINISGILISDNAFVSSDFVDIALIKTSRINITYVTGFASAFFYDSNKNPISNSAITKNIQEDFYIPENAKYVKFSANKTKYENGTDYLYIGIDPNLDYILNKIINKENITYSYSYWNNKKIVVVGDSIADYHYFPEQKGWAEIMGEILNCNILNYAKSGHTVSYNNAYGFSATLAEKQAASAGGVSYETAFLQNLDADLFIFQYGANDMWNFGDVNQPITLENRSNFEGAFNYVMYKLFKANPHARVVVLGFWHRYDWNKGSTSNNNMGAILSEHQKNISKRWNIKFINMADEIGWNDEPLGTTYIVNGTTIDFGENVSQIEIMSYRNNLSGGKLFDRLHPYEIKARDIMGKFMANKLNSIY